MNEIFVGTSGWAYDWNLGSSLEWYVKESRLNSIELNMSYYRFPFPGMLKAWSKKGATLAWVVKVHRSITHFKKLNKESYAIFDRFKKIFSPLEKHIHYYLFQFPPSFKSIDPVENFINECGNEKVAMEFRHPSLFTDDMVRWGEKQGILLVSVDAPEMPNKIMSKNIIYERVHGRTDWYSHNYSDEELSEIKERICSSKFEKIYVFFNNNHAMLENARRMHKLL
jgi:uncharacterized protein YecE (DUF72 family)